MYKQETEVSRRHVLRRYHDGVSVHHRKGTVQRHKRKESLGERSKPFSSYLLYFPPSSSFCSGFAGLPHLDSTCRFCLKKQAEPTQLVETILSAFRCLNALNVVHQALFISTFPGEENRIAEALYKPPLDLPSRGKGTTIQNCNCNTHLTLIMTK